MNMTKDTIDLERCEWDIEYRARVKRVLNEDGSRYRRAARSLRPWIAAHDDGIREAA